MEGVEVGELCTAPVVVTVSFHRSFLGIFPLKPVTDYTTQVFKSQTAAVCLTLSDVLVRLYFEHCLLNALYYCLWVFFNSFVTVPVAQ
jgi:hypothetical protein